MSPDSAPDPAEQLREEIERLRANLEKVQGGIIKAALVEKIAYLEKRLAKLTKPKKEEVEEEEAPLEPPNPKQLQEAEGYVRQARVEKMRGNAQAATDLLRKAAQAAPTAPAVLEALADDLVERRLKKEAIALYEKAIKLDPKNVGLDRKRAFLVLGSSAGAMSVEEALSADWGAMPGTGEGMASPAAATILTLFMPGLGHIVLGKTSAGATILGLWGVCVLWLLLMAKTLEGTLHALFGKGGHANYIILIPVFGLIVIYAASLNSLRAPRRSSARLKVDHPRPPVDLPFE